MKEEHCRCPGCGDCGGREQAADLLTKNKILVSENKRLRAALQKIVQPIKTMQQEAEEKGYRLNGGMAVALAADPNWYREVAKKALAAKRYKPDSENEDVDMKGKTCKKCKKGKYDETSIYDDWDGKLHCVKCGHETKRYAPETK